MTLTCKNCNNHFKGNFCNHCGQSAHTHRLNALSVWEDILGGIFRINHRIAFTTKQLCLRLGHAIRDFIDGKRLRFLQPISYAIVVASAYALLAHLFGIHVITNDFESDSIFTKLGVENTNDWIVNHYSWIALLTIPLFTISTFLVYRRSTFNLVEHLVINSFLTAQRFLYLIAVMPLTYLFNDTDYFHTYTYINLSVEFLLMLWSLGQLYPQLPKFKGILLLFASWLIFLGLFMLSVLMIEVSLEWFVLNENPFAFKTSAE